MAPNDRLHEARREIDAMKMLAGHPNCCQLYGYNISRKGTFAALGEGRATEQWAGAALGTNHRLGVEGCEAVEMCFVVVVASSFAAPLITWGYCGYRCVCGVQGMCRSW